MRDKPRCPKVHGADHDYGCFGVCDDGSHRRRILVQAAIIYESKDASLRTKFSSLMNPELPNLNTAKAELSTEPP